MHANLGEGNLVCYNHCHAEFVGQTLQASEKKSEMLLPVGELASADVIRPVVAQVGLFHSMRRQRSGGRREQLPVEGRRTVHNDEGIARFGHHGSGLCEQLCLVVAVVGARVGHVVEHVVTCHPRNTRNLYPDFSDS